MLLNMMPSKSCFLLDDGLSCHFFPPTIFLEWRYFAIAACSLLQPSSPDASALLQECSTWPASVFIQTRRPLQVPWFGTLDNLTLTRHGLEQAQLVFRLQGVGEAVGVQHVRIQPLRLQPHMMRAPRKPREFRLQRRAVPAHTFSARICASGTGTYVS